jgi:hypothetical protein
MSASVGRDVANWVRDALETVESWAAGLGAADLVLLVAVLWAAFWMWAALRAATRLGPVEVTQLDVHPEDKTVQVHALTTLLRERLAKSGLMPPPEVPAGSPQTNLIAAVESSGHPQAPWVAKALSLIPQPPRPPAYKLTGTLLGAPPPPPPEVADPATAATGPQDPPNCGLRYWLQPKEAGRPHLETVEAQESHEEAVRQAAADVFLAISRDAVHVFPPWSQWHDREALTDYLEGIYARFRDDDVAAAARFQAAIDKSQSNMLPHLQLANLLEKAASVVGAGGLQAAGADPLELKRARALRKYLDIGVARSDIVSARYRAGVVAATLAADCPMDEAMVTDIREILGLDDAGELSEQLYKLAADETRAAYQLVGRSHVALYEQRLRHRYEPAGLERRRLRRTIAISRTTLKLRRIGNDDSRRSKLKILWWRTKVRCLHLGLLRASAGWNAHYCASCFYALLYDRELDLAEAAYGAS